MSNTVLLVDDEREIRSSLRGILEEEGLAVIEAADGAEALAAIQLRSPDLIILDIWMPELDGLQLLQQLQGAMPPPEVIVISGHGNIETAVKATKLGAFDFLEKPLSLDAVLAVVQRALSHRQQRIDGAVGDGSAAAASRGDAGSAVARSAAARAALPQRTLGRSVVASGHGLHTGVKTGLVLQPAPPGTGVVFTSLSAERSVPALVDWVDSTGYATALHREGVTVQTVEHILATLHAYRVTNVQIKFQGEIPIMDGSAQDFCALIESAGVVEQAAAVEEIVVGRVIAVEGERGERIAIEPDDGFAITYTLIYPPPVGTQEYTFRYTGPNSFRDEIAPARTFGFLRDMKQMATMGLASGGRLDNCILIDDEKVVNTDLRFPEELARHKILDVMGDSYLLGRPLRGHIRARKTGHSDNIALMRAIRQTL
ncbi:MAG TPA: UDP-3-O-acyl-N-acetylglucosamine deacetylase [Terriglobales bacterium]|nr:UDP-3-O-acyl-N-acetylglucosamine deacetylase [Terriglobales bacterium]